MSFTILAEAKKIAKITLTGEIDSLSAREFQKEIEKMAAESPDELVLFVENLTFISSAGLRVLIFAKQKMGSGLAIYIVKPQESVIETLEKTGLQHSVNIVDQYL
ncbi:MULTISPECIES: STAS domain-containing protein [Spirosoma]|jgi:anti-anti-sigma factor|uniref:Anti-sigma factor antagonist n=2 Tax=Spirosoma TaxID=107 RepID=A0A6G9ALV8_9BACT|nr:MULTISPECIES: STAS domain-containing protein [Spirosoma]QHV95984.1 anti-sigma factor antagonist [Spirosoma endbachense]QIP13193.1 STAS domain-containing protein [Spirosoma aureum]